MTSFIQHHFAVFCNGIVTYFVKFCIFPIGSVWWPRATIIFYICSFSFIYISYTRNFYIFSSFIIIWLISWVYLSHFTFVINLSGKWNNQMKTCFKKWHEKENKLKILAQWTRTALEPDALRVSSTWKMVAERIRNDAWEVTRGHSLNQDLKSRNWFIWLDELPKLHNMWNRQTLWKIQVWHWWTRTFCPVHLVLVFWSWGSHRLANALLSR